MVDANLTANAVEVGSLYQWDRNQVLEIHGLSLPATPEVHFAHEGAEFAHVRRATMDRAGIIRVTVPDELLEKARPVKVYVFLDFGESFRSFHTIRIPVIGRSRPGPYEEETDG